MFCYFVQTLEQSLYGFIGTKLVDLVRSNDYPIHPNVAIWTFGEAFRKSGFTVDYDDAEQMMTLSRSTFVPKGGKDFDIFNGETSIGYEAIMEGYGYGPFGSLMELDHSTELVFDKLIDELPTNVRTKKFRKKMGHSLKGLKGRLGKEINRHIMRYHEGVLVPFFDEPEPMEDPNILSDLLRDLPIEEHLAIAYSMQVEEDNDAATPKPEELLDDTIWGQFDEDFYPTVECMHQYLWGNYLLRLSALRSFPLASFTSDDPLEDMVMKGGDALETGRLAWKSGRP